MTTQQIELMDTTLRDGEQTRGVAFSPEEKVNIGMALLQKLGVDRIEVASANVSEGEKLAVRTLTDWASSVGKLARIEVLGFVDHKRSVDWILDAGGNTLNLLTKGSELHCHTQLGKTLEEHLADIHATVEYALSRNLHVNVYLEDWSNGFKDSPDYVYALLNGMKDLDIKRFLLPDTLGVMSPDDVFKSIRTMVQKFPDFHFDFHPHNDYGLGTANVVAAVQAGVQGIHCTVNCLGERAGNASLAEVAVVLKDKLNKTLSIDENHIFALSKMVESFSGKWVAENAPIVGQDVFTQTAGIHADGDQKGGLYESNLRPERFDRKRSYALGKMSGKASLRKNLNALNLNLSEENQKKVLKRIVQLGDSKQSITIDDLPFIIADVLESKDYHHIQLLDCSITSRMDLESSVEIEIEIDNVRYRSSGTGNGGYDAFVNAVNKTLANINYQLPKLLNYEIRIPRGGETHALTECSITWMIGQKNVKTRGIHANQVFAAIIATLRIANMELHELKNAG